jgi:diacylglycerol kinase family enzyme
VHCEAVDVAASLDGEDISGRYVLFEAINLRYVGPNMFLAPGSKPSDGLLDVVLVTDDERAHLLEYLNKWQDNPERRAVLPTRRGKRLKIEWTGYELHIDDKLYPREDDEHDEMSGIVEAWIQPASVELLVPETKKA